MEKKEVRSKAIRKRKADSEEEQIIIEETSFEVDFGLPDNNAPLSLWEKVGKACLYAGLFLAPLFFLPFTASPIETNKIALLALLMLLGGGAFLAETVRRRTISYPRSSVAFAFFIFIAVLIVSTVLSISGTLSAYAHLRNADSLLVMGIVGMALFLSSVFLDARDRKPMQMLLLLSTTILTMIGIPELFGKMLVVFNAAQSTAATPAGGFSVWGMMIAIGAFVALCSLRTASRKGEKRMLMVVLLLHFAGLVLLNYPYHWLAIGITGLILAGLQFVEGKQVRSLVAMALMAFILFFAGHYIPLPTQASVEVRPNFQSSLQVAESSLGGARMLFGNGPSTFALLYSRFRTPESNQSLFWNMRFSDGYDAPLTLLATGGLVGLLAFLFFIGVFLLFLVRGIADEDMPWAAGALVGIVMWFFYPFSVAGLFIVFMSIGFLLSLAAPRGSLSFENSSRGKLFLFLLFVMVGIVFLAWMAWGLGLQYIAAVVSERGVASVNQGNVTEGVGMIAQAANLDPSSDEYAQLLSGAYMAGARQMISQGASSSEAQSVIASAVSEAQRATVIDPRDPWNWANAASVYENIIGVANGADAAAMQSYVNAQGLDPQNPDNLIGQARIFLTSASAPGTSTSTQSTFLSRAGSILLNAIALKADYVPPRTLLAQLYFEVGDFAHAKQQLDEVQAFYPNDPTIHYQFGLLYYQNNAWDAAQQELEAAVALNSDYSNARYFLGLIYDHKGLRAQAIDQFQKIAALNPEDQTIQGIVANLKAGKPAMSTTSAPPKSQ